MDISLLLSNILSPPILLFVVGMAATLLRSDLSIPEPIPKLLALYLLWAIGFKGGVELHQSGFSAEIAAQLIVAIALSAAIAFATFFILKRRVGPADAGALAASYGSISAVTFITATAFLERSGIEYGGHMIAAMALMESPAIIVGVVLYRMSMARAQDASAEGRGAKIEIGELLREAFLNGAVFLLLGSLLVGLLTGEAGWRQMKPFTVDVFPGVLAFFLLDMGLIAARRLRDLREGGLPLIAFGIAAPLVNAMIAILAASALGMGRGDALLFAVLCGSASYIAVPAAIRMAIPEANPSLYVPMALAVTFPFNITVGIPLYLAVIDAVIAR